MANETSTTELRIDPVAIDILTERGVVDRDIDRIITQATQLSDGYRRPEAKLADVLAGGVALVDTVTLVLPYGSGTLERGGTAGECSEATRDMTKQWSESTMHRHLANNGFHPFYLEVAAPNLFRHQWDDGRRIRSGHTVLAIGQPEDYVKRGSDKSFVLIDPTLGVIEPMPTSEYVQTGYVVTPEAETRALVVPMTLQGDSNEVSTVWDPVPNLVLGIDPAARFVYALWFERRDAEIRPHIQVTDSNDESVANFDVTSRKLQKITTDVESFKQSLPTLERIAAVATEQVLEVHTGCVIDSETERIKVGEKWFPSTVEFRYPMPKKFGNYVLGMEYAAKKVEQTGASFSLKIEG